MTTVEKRRDSRIWGMAEARQVFPALSNASVQYWIGQGLVSSGRKESWRGEDFVFSAADLTHLGVVAELSCFGTFRKVANVHGWTGAGWRQETALELTDPGKVISFYKEYRYLVGIGVRRYFTGGPPLGKTEKRNKRTSVHYDVHFWPINELKLIFRHWNKGAPLSVGITHRSILFISVATIYAEVMRQVGNV